MVQPAAHLILTMDYELFGNGGGALSECVVAPTGTILSVAESFGAPVTLFVEALEFAAMRRLGAGRPVSWSAGLDEAERQVAQAVRRGHDAQLHLHPQWLDATEEGDGWSLNLRRWRIGDLPPSEVERALDLGISTLGKIVDGAPGHRDLVFRAGAWCIQPSAGVLPALSRAGLLIDSSVAPGLHHPARGDWYDFRVAPADRACWTVKDDVCRPEPGPTWEVPIAAAPVAWLRHIARKGASRLLERQGGLAPGCAGSYAGPNDRWQTLRGKWARLRSAGRAMLDFSTLDARQLIAIVRHWRERSAGSAPVPIVAIAHSKNFTPRSARELEAFLAWATAERDLVFSTFARWLEEAGPAGHR